MAAKEKRVPIYCGSCGQIAVYVQREAADRALVAMGWKGVAVGMAAAQLVSIAVLRCGVCETAVTRNEAIRRGRAL